MCGTSFGPCRFECGRSTPVMRNCARGNFAPSMAMKGIVPPSPIHIAGLPKCFCELSSIAASSHGSVRGAFQPSAAWPYTKLTFAPRSEEHTSELQSHSDLVCRLLLEKKKKNTKLYH